jgi:hypothetical protein
MEGMSNMSTTDYRSAKLDEKKARWETYFRKRLGDNHPRLRAAVDAAMRAAIDGASSQEAAAAGIAASNTNQNPRTQGTAQSGRPGMIVGLARGVRRHTQISNNGSIITLEFRLESPDSTLTPVQMQGSLLHGRIDEGDVVEVQRSNARGGTIVTDYAYNRSTNSEVNMRRGVSAWFGMTEAHWGRHWKRFLAIILGIVGLFVLIWVAWMIFIVSGFTSFSESRDEAPRPPAWICEEAGDMGGTPMPGC